MPGDVPELEFSTDRDRLDVDWVHRTLAEHAYWALGRSRDRQDAANAASRCYGVYAGSRQVGFARVITDGVTFAWLGDVIVDPGQRGNGVGKLLIAGVVADLEAMGVPRTLLATADAHGLYEQYGWKVVSDLERWMQRTAEVRPAASA